MLNSTIVIKVKQRINKLDSQDYDNLECWQIVEAFNKAQVEWCRRQLHGLNIVKEGDEQSTRRKDDLQVLLISDPITMTDKKDFFSGPVPGDYLQWKRVDVFACHGMGGIVGLLLTGIFAKDVGLIYGETETFTNHIYALIIISIFTFFGSYLLYKITAFIVPIRVSKEIEEKGLDRAVHGEFVN